MTTITPQSSLAWIWICSSGVLLGNHWESQLISRHFIMSSGVAQFTSFPFKIIQPLKLHNLGRFGRHIIDKCFFPSTHSLSCLFMQSEGFIIYTKGWCIQPPVFLKGRKYDAIQEPLKKEIWGLKAGNSIPGSDALAANTELGTCGTRSVSRYPNR